VNVPEYSTVVGVDEYHLRQLELVWPTWKKHKPSMLKHQMIAFYDRGSMSEVRIRAAVDHPDLQCIPWPMKGLDWDREKGEEKNKFHNPHRAMMLSGFVYVPAAFVRASYWLKLDTDVVATGIDDWIDPCWFEGDPVIVSHRWTFTRPADQMLKMDRWVEENRERLPAEIVNTKPLNLIPQPGWNRVGHKRIISWCGFFDTAWTRRMALLTRRLDGIFQLPIPSQDGYLWYMAERAGRKVVRTNMKSKGFAHWHTWSNIKKHAEEAMTS